MTDGIAAAFAVQAEWCRKMGAPITGRVVAGLAAAIDVTTATGRAVLGWTGEPVADALVLRLHGGVHALHRAGADDALSAVFEGRETDADAIAATLRRVLVEQDAVLLPWLAGPPQTNEVGRSAALMTGLLHLAARFGPRVELLEIGSSAGLNLAMGRYRFDLGGVTVGSDDAPLAIVPEWRGSPPPSSCRPVIEDARGVDIAPIDVTDPKAAARLSAYVWVDQVERQARLAAAIALARAHPVQVDRGDAADWLAARLAEPQPAGVTRVLIHSVVWQYLPPATQSAVAAAMAVAGERADADRPLGWVSLEPASLHDWFEVRVRHWPDGEAARVVAISHPHAAWLDTGASSSAPAS